MTSFHQQSWGDRFAKMGDQAEGVFEGSTSNGYVHYGLSRPPINMGKLPEFLRYTPDYLQHDRLVEVKGLGRDQVLKVKTEQIRALNEWDEKYPVDVFIYDSANNRYTQVSLLELRELIGAHAEIQQFPEGKSAWFMPVGKTGLEWTPAK